MLRLNIGNGAFSFAGYKDIPDISVSSDGTFSLKDVKDNSVCAVKLYYVLEKLGSERNLPSVKEFMKELYRVCRDGAVIEIRAHYDAFLSNYNVPGVVNVVNDAFVQNFDKEVAALNSRVGSLAGALDYDVDFKLLKTSHVYAPEATEFIAEALNKQASEIVSFFSNPNVVDHVHFYLMCNKGEPGARPSNLYAATNWPDSPNFGMRIYDVNRGSMFGSRGIKKYGVWEPHVSASVAYILKRLDKIDTPVIFANIGANLGWYTLFAAVNTNHVTVDAFEPTPETLEILNENIKINDLEDRVTVYPLALSDSKGEAEFFIDLDNAGSNSLMLFEEGYSELKAKEAGVEGHKVIKVQTDTLDNIYGAKKDILWPAILLMDVEGHEQKVFDGAAKLFEKNWRPIICVEFSPALMKLRGKCTYYRDLVEKYRYGVFICRDGNLEQTDVDTLDIFYKRNSENNASAAHLDLMFLPIDL